jgi:multiple sugar transport system ATP-binding protein
VSRVDLDKVWKIYPRGNVVGVKDLTFTVNDKEFVAILGPSGGGKSSTLRMLAGLEEISKGEIRFDGKVVNALGPAERNVALAFESYALYQRLSVYENIAFPLRARHMPKDEVDRKVTRIAELLDLTDLLKKFPSSLAGGQQQRVSLGRAFVRQPNLTLLDEPISHMDQRVRAEIRARIRHLHEEMGNTTVYVTHDQAEAVSLCDRLVIINKAELQQTGTVGEIWNTPANRFVAYFVGEPSMNFITVRAQGDSAVVVQTGEGPKTLRLGRTLVAGYEGKEVTAGMRPQQLKVHRKPQPENVLPGAVRVVDFQGENTILTLSLGAKADDRSAVEVKAVVAATERYAVGEKVHLTIEPKLIHVFDGETVILAR